VNETLFDVILLMWAAVSFVCTLTSMLAIVDKACDLSIEADNHGDYKHAVLKLKSFGLMVLTLPTIFCGATLTAFLVVIPTGLVTF
jgi:hypothetical protein